MAVKAIAVAPMSEPNPEIVWPVQSLIKSAWRQRPVKCRRLVHFLYIDRSYKPRLSFTATEISCSAPRYRSVVCIDECPSKNLICSRSPPAFRQSLAQVRRRSWAPNRSTPISFADCSTTDQTAQSLKVSPIFPPFEIERSSRPSSIPAALIQELIPCLTQTGTATVRTRLPFPSRSASTQRPSRSWIVSTTSEASSCRRRAQPTSSARITSPLELWPNHCGLSLWV